ncbi:MULTISPECIES: FitA-like ribbon-helix-helix domain-containing protein [Alphaproteobacteria]|uniref:Plasmid stabilization protein n=2 Tax=Alphaproteobacteria TaxID=28211 RepID=A0A512HGV9_9HYPH|nr:MULTISPECIES: plasmid stabilization protein [Alphaproteobacteria]GEO84672.1 plasmid stabilization protein [Ciceribacter naphthalenivorans]GLR20707.1 plasmid stabilization protein [Ciceribacter naphthalenivorans]GLT03563.1 plasmid stabilization protein [Sphingomonas psychrolutea]
MASVTIRNLDDGLKQRLRVRAATRGHSMEEEARDILRVALSAESRNGSDLAETIRRRVAALGGVELEIAPREPIREAPAFGE